MMIRKKFLSFAPPCIGDEEIQEVIDTLRSDWITTGPKTKQFEKNFCDALGAPGALALNSCTAALHSALVALGVGPGDEVITTPMTFAATANVIEHTGAKTVLADVEPDTLNIDPKQIEAKISPQTKVIIPVHYAGHPVDLDPINALASAWDISVLEDAAHAIPASYKGRAIGSGTNPVAFSFYATKNMTTSEGGMITGDPRFLDKVRVVSLHGMDRDAWKRYHAGGSWSYDVVMPGFKYNMTDVQAAMGLHQLKKLSRFQARRNEIVAAYAEAFGNFEELELPVTRPEVGHAWHLYVLRLREEMLTIGRDQFIEELKARNIGTSVHFIPIHMHSYYRNKYGYQAEDFPVAASNFRRMLSIPLSPALGDQDVLDVIAAVTDVVLKFRKRSVVRGGFEKLSAELPAELHEEKL
jgi:dTDP-4-amino-4,6-dideoxygalactose transaminase